MISKDTFSFLNELKEHNTKEWFDANRPVYEKARQEFVSFMKLLLKEMTKFDPELKDLEPKDCIFRINRDIRFSADKTPYKTNFGAAISKGGKKAEYAGYYLHLEPGNSFLAGGRWNPIPEDLKKIRQEIVYNTQEFKDILSDKNFVKFFKEIDPEFKTKMAPKGIDKDFEDMDLVKYKSYVLYHKLTDSQVLGDDFIKYIVSVYKAMLPFNKFLNVAIS